MTQTPNNRSCQPRTLSRQGFVHIQRCEDCGGVSVHVGAVTLRLEVEAIYVLWRALEEALEHLDSESRSPGQLHGFGRSTPAGNA
ncbi:MAG: hypothetical protein R3A78_06840 [Polyangiales bacterium]